MSIPRIAWDQLPSTAKTAVAEHTGPIHSATTVTGGTNSAIAARLKTAHSGFFVKGARLTDPQVHTQRREAEINPHLPASSPRIVWHIEVDGWDLIGFELLDGVHADFSPDSPDLPKVVDALIRLAQISCPGLPLKRIDQRWAEFAPPSALSAFKGDNLLHTDLAPHNILIHDQAHVVDWAWPARGPAWVDAGIWIVRLIDAGHSPREAEIWGERLPAWREAPADALTAFSHANAAMWDEIAQHDDAEWKIHLATSAREWAEYRASR